MIVSVTQFIPPNGVRRTGYIEIPDAPDRQRKYNELSEEGCNIAGEVRTPGAVSDRYEIITYISCEYLEDDFLTHITPHPSAGGPSMTLEDIERAKQAAQDAVAEVIDLWDKEQFLAWKAALLASRDTSGRHVR